ncbi:hypothetical protein EAI_12430, partial [Harpegnathos saltator]
DLLLCIDNSTALSYIHCMGSISFPHLSAVARQVWSRYANRDLFLYAAYVPSTQNVETDAQSHIVSTETEWSLSCDYFHRIESGFDPFDIDLFASSIYTKCPCFVSWLPDPLAHSIDAFSLDWSKFYFFAFPPFILILRVLRKIISDKAERVLVVP